MHRLICCVVLRTYLTVLERHHLRVLGLAANIVVAGDGLQTLTAEVRLAVAVEGERGREAISQVYGLRSIAHSHRCCRTPPPQYV